MSYVNPTTQIYLIEGCPLDVEGEHTYKFASETEQQRYFFTTLTHYGYSNYTRVEPNGNTLRVSCVYATARKCNYIAFRNNNADHEQKWYYGFIVTVNYINEAVTEIVYALDYMQTYLFDFDVSPCLVEREHTKTDTFGEHVVPEGLETGEYVFNTSHKNTTTGPIINPQGVISLDITSNLVYIILSSDDVLMAARSAPGVEPTVLPISDFYPVGRTFCGIGVFVCIDAETLGYVLAKMTNWQSSIAAVFAFPAAMINWNCVEWASSTLPNIPSSYKTGRIYDQDGRISIAKRANSDTIYYTDGRGNQYTAKNGVTLTRFFNEEIDGYTPFNNKMYCSPYVIYSLNNNVGETCNYNPEFFTQSVLGFDFISAITSEPSVMGYPRNYKNSSLSCYEEGLTMSRSFPMLPWTYNTFKEWLYKNQGSLALSFAQGAVGTILPIASYGAATEIHSYFRGGTPGEEITVQNRDPVTGRFMSGTTTKRPLENVTERMNYSRNVVTNTASTIAGSISGFMQCANTLAQIASHASVPPTIRGQVNNGNINISNNINDFYFSYKTVRADFAERIDNYFSRYGYQINKFKMPNIFDTNGTPRRRWNYLKTTDVKVHPKTNKSFNLEVESALENLLNRGITFWNPNNGTMYDYTQTPSNNNKPQ